MEAPLAVTLAGFLCGWPQRAQCSLMPIRQIDWWLNVLEAEAMWPNAPNVKQTPSKLWGLPPLLLGISVELLLERFGPAAIANSAGASVAAVSFVAIVGWRLGLSREQWFRPFIAAAVVIHAGAIFLICWPTATSTGGESLFPLMALADIILTVIAGAFLAKLWKTSSPR